MCKRHLIFSVVIFFLFAGVNATPVGAQNLSPETVQGSVTISAGGFRLDRRTGEFAQQLVVENKGATVIARPVYVTLAGLDARVSVRNANGNATVPAAVPTFMAAGRDGSSLQPGERTVLILRFRTPEGVPLAYRPQLLLSPPR
jgi:hypothetical protein